MKEIVGKVWPCILGGIALEALIHGYVPEDFMASFMGYGVMSTPGVVIDGKVVHAGGVRSPLLCC